MTIVEKMQRRIREMSVELCREMYGEDGCPPLGTRFSQIEDDAIAPVVAQETIRDGFWCKARCAEWGETPVKVPAPLAFRNMGIEFINAYPRPIVAWRVSQRYLD